MPVQMRIMLLGPPGVGKSVYAGRIARSIGIPHISTGDLLRSQMKALDSNSDSVSLLRPDEKTEVARTMESGSLVPSEIVSRLLRRRLELEDCVRGYLLDGFPRTVEQARSFAGLDAVLHMIQYPDIIIEKLGGRRVCPTPGCATPNYNIVHVHRHGIDMPPMPPQVPGTCDTCKSKLIKRPDDDSSTVKKRLQLYESDTLPLVELYRARGILVDVAVAGAVHHWIPAAWHILGNSSKTSI
ncbi:mitochondrial adenylate kinase [Andalucia godoyi]|uniref:Mitochondrial adenylate kinase n=1 Tax=Andalucia godoyi TaxID=505711 RepID=A0A8K0AHV8_ANDGO|nr:mitochondrial adenylate kinase [Andalucia godoyi]|eukprot:ANDGO_04094.mRNA.1 mitochondrial adenylate kinase